MLAFASQVRTGNMYVHVYFLCVHVHVLVLVQKHVDMCAHVRVFEDSLSSVLISPDLLLKPNSSVLLKEILRLALTSLCFVSVIASLLKRAWQ